MARGATAAGTGLTDHLFQTGAADRIDSVFHGIAIDAQAMTDDLCRLCDHDECSRAGTNTETQSQFAQF